MSEKIGLRKTEKRELIYEIIKSAPGPLSANDILRIATERNSSIGIATIYRTIKILLNESKVEAVNLPDGQHRYTTPSLKHLHYFHCKSCDVVLAIDHCCTHLHKDEVNGHQVDEHYITLAGVCQGCR